MKSAERYDVKPDRGVLSKIFIRSHCKVQTHNPKRGCACREKKKRIPDFDHTNCPTFEHVYLTKLDYRKWEWVKKFVLIQSYRPLPTLSHTYLAAWIQI